MLNPQLIINTPTANGTAVRSDAAPASTNGNGSTNDSFGNVLAKHLGEQSQSAKSPATQNGKVAKSSDANSPSTQDQSTGQPATDATSATLASMLHGSSVNKAASIVKGQDKTASNATDTATLVAGMFGNQSAMSGAVSNAGSQVGIDPVTDQKRLTGIDPAAGNRVGIDPVTGNIRKAGASPVTGNKGAIGTDPVGNSGMVGIDPVTAHNGMVSIDSAAAQNASTKARADISAITAKNTAKPLQTADGATARKFGPGTARDITQQTAPLTAPLKTEAILQSTLKPSIESVKSNELTSANTAPSAQTITETGSIPIAASQTPDNAANAGNISNNTIAAPLGSNAWPAEFAQKITWVSTQQNQIAELHLNPPDLGPMSVVLSISDNQATAVFSSPHSAVRDAIENAMPKLRESMAENGIMLGNASVNDQAPRDNGAYNDMNQRSASRISPQTDTNATVAAPTSLPPRPASRHNGMVDTFA